MWGALCRTGRRTFASWTTVALIAACSPAAAPDAARPPVVPEPAASSATAAPIASSAAAPVTHAPVLVAAQWVLCERTPGATRWVLVKGMLPQGSDEPAADADYVVVRTVDEAFARASRLPVRTITLPRFYTLPEAFSVTLHVDTDPPGARVYEVAAPGVLVPHGTAPVDITFTGDVSDLRARLAGSTWLTTDLAKSGVTAQLWAGNDSLGSTADLTPVAAPLLDARNLEVLRGGAKKLTRNYTLSVHAPLTPQNRAAIQAAVIVNIGVGQ